MDDDITYTDYEIEESTQGYHFEEEDDELEFNFLKEEASLDEEDDMEINDVEPENFDVEQYNLENASTPAKKQRSTPKRSRKRDSQLDSLFSLARQQLQLSTIPDLLPGREDETDKISSILKKCILNKGQGACLFLSGVPGTGKTATIFQVINLLQKEVKKKQLPSFKFVELNAMRLTAPQQAYCFLYKELTGKKVPAVEAANRLNKLFTSRRAPMKNQKTVIVAVDEIDVLVTKKQSILYNFFEWPTRMNSGLVVIGISNTMNLPEQMTARVNSRLGLRRIIFNPYGKEQLETIIQSRLGALTAFESNAITLVAIKIASVSGDARRALELCRRAATIAEMENQIRKENNQPSIRFVSMKHIDKGIQEMFFSHRTQLIRSLSLHDRLFLLAVVLELRQTGLLETRFGKVISRFWRMCEVHPNTPLNKPTADQLMYCCANLGVIRLLVIEPGIRGLDQKIILNVNENDVLFAVNEDPKIHAITNQLMGTSNEDDGDVDVDVTE